MSTPEGKVKTKVRAELMRRSIYHFMPATGGYGRSGVPDIVGCYRGCFFAIETKAGNNKPTALQERELKQIRDDGGIAFVINENNLDELIAWLNILQ
jgi:hypothetical protein